MKSFIRYCTATLVVLLGVAVYSAKETIDKGLCDDEPSQKETGMYSALLQRHSKSTGSAYMKHDDENCIENFTRYDARNYGLVPGIRHRVCDACWAYAAIGILECSYLKVNRGVKPWSIDFSEKQLLVCTRSVSDTGCKGFMLRAIDYLSRSKVRIMEDKKLPEDGYKGPCPTIDSSAKLQMRDWGMVDPLRGYNRIPSIEKMKQAICRYGPIAVSMNSTEKFINFKGDTVFFERKSHFRRQEPSANHVVIIVGWDDNKHAWLVRNCWGLRWAMNGYAWVHYNTNNIGVRATWVVARKTNSLRF